MKKIPNITVKINCDGVICDDGLARGEFCEEVSRLKEAWDAAVSNEKNPRFKPGDKVLVSYDGITWFHRYFESVDDNGRFVATRAMPDEFTNFMGAVSIAYKYCKPYLDQKAK